MSIITVEEVKDILGIDGSSYDNDINRLIPYVQNDVLEYCNTFFQDNYVYRESGSYITMTQGSTQADYITDADDKFLQKGFASGMDIAVEGGWSNVGVHHVVTASTDTLTLDSTGELISQDPNDTNDNNYIGNLKISRVRWPKGIKLPVAQMIDYMIAHPKPNDIKSESIDDYSVTYVGENAYPTRIIRGLKQYRKASLR